MNIQFSDYRRFVASIGLALIIISFTLPWLVLKEPILVDVKQSEVAEYTNIGQYNVYFRQAMSLGLSVLSCCFAPIFFVSGISLLLLGFPLWAIREISQERREYLLYKENEKHKEELETLKKEVSTSNNSSSSPIQIKQKIDIVVKQSELSISRIIDAPASKILEILRDYKNQHYKILPTFNYKSYVVEEGGFGAGTVLSYQMRVRGVGYLFMSKWKKFISTVSEVEGMGFLQETMTKPKANKVFWVKTYLIESLSEEQTSRVTILTKIATDNGLWGSLQRLNAELLYTPIFKEELEVLDKLTTK